MKVIDTFNLLSLCVQAKGFFMRDRWDSSEEKNDSVRSDSDESSTNTDCS